MWVCCDVVISIFSFLVVSSELVVELPRESSKESTTTAATAAVAHHLGNSLYKQSHTAEQTSESQEFLGNPNYALPGILDPIYTFFPAPRLRLHFKLIFSAPKYILYFSSRLNYQLNFSDPL